MESTGQQTLKHAAPVKINRSLPFARNIIVAWVAAISPAYSNAAQQVDSLTVAIRYEDALAVKCYDGHLPLYWPGQGAPPSPACRDLNIAIEDLNLKTKQASFSYFLGFRRQWLFSQLDRCSKFGMAGNEQMAMTCRTKILNAHDFLTQLAFGRGEGNPLITQWMGCSHELESDLEFGARCIVAARDMAPCQASATNHNDVVDYSQCITLLTSGAWTANPKALRISFDTPRTDAVRFFSHDP